MFLRCLENFGEPGKVCLVLLIVDVNPFALQLTRCPEKEFTWDDAPA
jgi:hypothetical protein